MIGARNRRLRDPAAFVGDPRSWDPLIKYASASKSADLLEEVVRLVDRAVEASRASLLRDLSPIWPRFRQNLAKDGTASRASFGDQGLDPPAESGPDPAGRHA